MGSTTDVNLEICLFKIRALAAAGGRFFRFRGSKLGANIEQTRSENEVQDKVHVGIDF